MRTKTMHEGDADMRDNHKICVMSQLGHAIDPDAIVCTINGIGDGAGAGPILN
jgi:hypothetical protein